ncbi:MAG: HupE/UreJ family protein [Pseudomonadota bacterium]
MGQVRFGRWQWALCLLALAGACAHAHPEDEFCLPGVGGVGLDAALCEQLATLDSAEDRTARLTQPILDASGDARSAASTFLLYVSIGVQHILPGGLDHILFVLALFLTSTRLRALLVQITTFTVAHTATLGLAAAGVISPSASIVEPLIAASIAFVALENLFVSDMPRWRPVIVFAFGLLHGLGFAGFFGELGLPANQFWSGLVGFNVGVEVGQLSVVLLAFLLVSAWRRMDRSPQAEMRYRRRVVLPGSLAIGFIGLWWAIERTFLG